MAPALLLPLVLCLLAQAGTAGAATRPPAKWWAVAPAEKGAVDRSALVRLQGDGVNAVVVDATKLGGGKAGAQRVDTMWKLARGAKLWLVLVDPSSARLTPAVRRAIALCSSGATAVRCADLAPSAQRAAVMAKSIDALRPVVALYASRPGVLAGLRSVKSVRRHILVIAPLYASFDDSVWGPAIAGAAASPGIDLGVAPTSSVGSASVQRFGASLGGTTTIAGAPPDTTPPTTPAVGVDSVGSSSAIISWLPSTDDGGISAYRVYVNGTRVSDNASSPATVASLTCGVAVTLGVEAVDTAGNVSQRGTVTVTPGPCGGGGGGGGGGSGDTTPPTAPLGLTVGGVGRTSLTFTWNPSSDNSGVVTGYRVYSNGTLLGTTFVTSYLVGGLVCGTTYTLGVAAIDAAGNVSFTSIQPATTSACDATPPSTPVGLVTSNVSQTAATLTWGASSDDGGVAGYRVFRSGTQVATVSGTNYTFTNLSCGTSYTVGVAAYDDAGNVSSTSTTNLTTQTCAGDSTPPSTPSALATSGVSASQATLSWTASTDNVGVTGYRLLRGGSQVGTSTSTSYTFTGLTCGTTYTLGVAATDAAGNISPTASTSVTTPACPDTTAPTTPTALATSGITQTQATLTWTASTDNVGVTGYRAFRNGTQAGTPPTTSYTFTGLTCGTTYTLGVSANDAAGNVSSTATTSVTTTACPDTTAPTTPTGLSASGVTQTQATLAWTASTDNVGVTGYRTFRNGTQVGSSTTTTYTFTGLACGTTYTLGVAALDAAGNVSLTASGSVTTAACPDTTAPSTPTTLATTGVTQTGVTLSWSASTDNVGVTSYRTFRNGTQAGSPTTTSYAYTGLTCGTTYTLGVAALDAAGNVSTTATTSVTTAGCPDTTAPSVPAGLLTSGVGQSSVGLSWNVSTDNVGVAGYRLFQNGSQVGTATTPSYIFGGLSCGTAYTLGVAAYDAAGNVSATATTSVTTGACADTTAPSAPTALATSAVGQTSATLSWTASTDNVGVTGYRLFRGGTQVGTSTSTSYGYSGLTCATGYTLGVAGVDAAGNVSTTTTTSVTTSACSTGGTANVAVSTSGSDTTCVRGDLTKPCATLAKAYLVAQPGDVVTVAAGTYPFQQIVKGSQSQSGPAITLQCATAHACTVNGIDLGQNNGSLSGDTPSYLTFDGIDVHGSVHGYLNQNADPQPTHITLKNGHVWSITSGGSGIMLNSPDSLTLQDMEIGPICCGGGGSGDDGIELGLPRSGAPSPSNIVLDRVYIHDLYDSCAHLPAAISSQYGTCSGTGYGDGCTSCDHVDGIQVYGAHGFVMQNSRIYAVNPGYPVGQGLFMQEANGGSFTNVTLQNNMFASTPNNTVSMSGPGSGSWSGYLHVYYNTIQGNLRLYGSSGSQIFAPGTPVIVAGNIIGNLASSNNNGCSIILSDNSTFTPTYSHNLNANQKCGATDFLGSASFANSSGTTPDLHLSGAQTAVDNGEPTYAPSTDFDGDSRPNGVAADIGADER